MSDNFLSILREKNPFASSASPLPWDNGNPDLQQLNRAASEEIEQLMRHKRRQPNLPLAGLILGEAGSGKTHMLTRILRRLRSTAGQAIFVAVKTFRDPNSVTQHLLSEIFISLRRIHSKGRTQFDVIASEVMDVYKERRLNDGFTDLSRVDPKIYLARDIPNLDRNFLKCLLLYIGTSDESVRADVLDWLCDGLEDDDALRLGLPLKDTNSMTDAKRESEAEKVLISLGLILAYAKIPMVICFDQLDAMKDKTLITAWGNIIALIMNDLSGILPLCFLRSQIWSDVFLPVLDEAVSQRLSTNIIRMEGCSISQAKLIIYERIKSAFGENKNSEEIFNRLISKMNITAGMSPRSVIELANHTINNTSSTTAPAPEGNKNNTQGDIFATMRGVYEDEYRKVQEAPHSWPPNAEQITLALDVWLKSHEGVSFSKSDIKNMRIRGKYNGVDFAFIITTSKSHFVASAGLKHGINFLEEHKNGLCFYVSEARIHKKTWNNANEILKEFQSKNGRAVILDENTRIKWYALTALINRIDNGDVNLYTNSKARTATREDAKIFVKTIALLDFPFEQPEKISQGAPQNEIEFTPFDDFSFDQTQENFDPAALKTELTGILNNSPMKIITAAKAVEFLAQRKIFIGRENLLSFVRENNKVFKTYQSRNDTLITLQGKF